MKPHLLNLLKDGNYSQKEMALLLGDGWDKQRVNWFCMELERRGWIKITRSCRELLSGKSTNNLNEYSRRF